MIVMARERFIKAILECIIRIAKVPEPESITVLGIQKISIVCIFVF